MIKRIASQPIYPFLFVLFVILALLVTNIDEIDPALAARPAAVSLLCAAGLLLLFRAVFKDRHYAGYLAFLILFMFFTYGHLYNGVAAKLPKENAEVYPYALLGVQGALLAGLGFRPVWRRLGGPRLAPILNLAAAFLVVVQSGIGLAALIERTPPLGWKSGVKPVVAVTGPVTELDCSRSPDIYWIILDGYGRADMLKEIYDVDTSGFLESLKEMGFYVAEASHANYIQTVYAVPSALNFQYLPPKPANVNGYAHFPELIAQNRLTELLRQCGYQTVSFETGFIFTNYPDADVYLQYGADHNEFEELLLSNTPLELVQESLPAEPRPRSYEAHRARVNFAFDQLAGLPAMDGPQFVYAHIVSPHPPFVFDSHGSPIRPRRGYSISDGSDYLGTWAEYKAGYAGQVQYVNRRVEEAVRAILARSAEPPVIIIQGDHGPGGHLEWDSPERTCLRERTSILLAYYLPEGGSRLLYPEISPVNSFRVVLDAYFGVDMALLPDETYFTSHKPGGAFINITEQRDSNENCD